jgi:hypothetical protein
MRKLLGSILLLTILLLLVVACTGGPSSDLEVEEGDVWSWDWSTLKSPETGRCYEIVTRQAPFSDYMGMAEISCSELPE